METRIRQQLIKLARLKTTWAYSQLNEQLQLGLDFNVAQHRDVIGDWLGDISKHEYNNERPLLSALITHKYGQREQGDGFYKLCEELIGKNWLKLKEDKEWENKMIADCYTYWLNPENYRKYKDDF